MLENLRSLSCSAKQLLKVPNSCSADNTPKITYNVTVTTGAMKFAGTDANVYFRLTGAGGDRSARIKLDNAFRDDFERGSTDKFRVKLEDIGVPSLVTLEVDHLGLFADWFAAHITVQKAGDKQVYEFPVYSWVNEVIVIPDGKACLPQNEDNSMLLGFRENELFNRKRLYKWRSRREKLAKGLPGYISTSHDDLPRNLQYTDGMLRTFEESKGVVVMHAFQDKIQALSNEIIDKWESLDEISHFMSHPKLPTMPEFQKDWQDDCEFGRQMANGCNPLMIQRCKELPGNFSVANEMVKKFIAPGTTLEKEIQKGNIFIIDCKIAKDVPVPPNGCVPICLLYQHPDGKLKPIAIQLQQSPGFKNPIWTPNDSSYDWILAKMYFRNAESNMHQIVYRLLHTHLVLEPFAVAMMRCLSGRHPMFKLLYPHLQFVCATNTMIRTSIISPGGIFDNILTYGSGSHLEVLRKAFKTFSLDSLNIPKEIKKQGTESLKNYHYRDDALKLFECIRVYVERMVFLYYKSDNDIINDQELQTFISEVHNDGFAWEDKSRRGCPTCFTNKKELIEIFTMIIFTSSCQHSAVTSGQLHNYIHVPNAPLSMSKPAPTVKGQTSMETVVSSLPDKNASCAQVDMANTFSKNPEEEVYLGNFPSRLFCDEDSQKVLSSFREDILKIGKSVKERNSKLKVPYEYLIPENISAGVTV